MPWLRECCGEWLDRRDFVFQGLQRAAAGAAGAAVAVGAAIVPAECALAAGDGAAMPIDEFVAYAVDDSSHMLLRYDFEADRVLELGLVQTSANSVLTGLESLAFLPDRLHLYAVWNYQGDSQSKVVKISLRDGTATLFSSDVGYGNIQGLAAMEFKDSDSNNGHGNDCDGYDEDNPGKSEGVNENGMGHGAHSGCWKLFAVCTTTGKKGSTHRLVMIDPESGRADTHMSLSRSYEGLAAGPNDMLYASSGGELWRIDPHALTETHVGSSAASDLSALDFARGDGESSDAVSVPGIDAEVTAEGVLMGFSRQNDGLVVLNTADGDAYRYESELDEYDVTGLIVLSRADDPISCMVAGLYD